MPEAHEFQLNKLEVLLQVDGSICMFNRLVLYCCLGKVPYIMALVKLSLLFARAIRQNSGCLIFSKSTSYAIRSLQPQPDRRITVILSLWRL